MQWKVLVLVVFLFSRCSETNRVRRHLVFNKGSRLFFAVNVRDNLFDYSDFFAHVFGVKMDWDLPHEVIRDAGKGRKIQRRDVYQGLEHFLHQYHLNGTSCIQKFVCETSMILSKSNHFLAQLFEILFTPCGERDAKVYGHSSSTRCEEVMEECPLSLIEGTQSARLNFQLVSD